VSTSASMTLCLCSVEPQKLDGGCVLCCVRREEELWRRGGIDGKPGERLHFGLTS
jgi:hypothetical protein